MYRRAFFAVVCLMGLFGGASVNGSPTGLCWRSLVPDTGNQNVRLASIELALASNGPDETWLSWQENDARIIRWFNGQWIQVPMPTLPGTEKMRFPAIAGVGGNIVLAASANGQEGTAALHIARWSKDSWEWIGAPLISSQLAFTHAHEASIAFGSGGNPVIAWSEERHVKLAGLFVSEWNGSYWQRLGTLSPEKSDRYYLAPTVTVGPDKLIWLGWKEGCGNLRIARWDGKSWHDIGREALQELAAGICSTAQLSLAIDSKGQAWLLWIASKRSGEPSLALARWNGNNWTSISVPHAPIGKDATVWSAHMILRNDLPIVAWSQSDATDNHRLYVSEWMEGDQWTPLISGLHLAEGVSDVKEVKLAPGDEQSFFISWDEVGEDKRRTRLVHAYACKTGESPASLPKSVAERDTWPSNVDEAASQIIGKLDENSKARLRSTKEEDLILYHHGWGTGIRNSLGLWRGNEKLLQSCGEGHVVHPDNCSMVIIEAVWKQLQKQSSSPELSNIQK